MNLKKNMSLIVGGGVFAVLGIVVLVLLLKFNAAYQRVNGELRSATQRLTALYQRDPYPSEVNVGLVQTNQESMRAFFDRLMASLQQGQTEPRKLEPAEFPLLLEKTIRLLYLRATNNLVSLPPRFAFGFDRYAAGSLPAAEDVPRLVIQLDTTALLCGLLFNARITEVVGIQRPVFEVIPGATAPETYADSRQQRYGTAQPEVAPVTPPYLDPSGLFSRERYVLTFRGRESALMEFLNSVARDRRFMVVIRAEFENEAGVPKLGLARPVATAPSPGQPAPPPPPPPRHEERVVAGREQIRATVEVEVYRFRAVKPGEGSA